MRKTNFFSVQHAIQNSQEYLVFAGVVNQWDQSAQRIQVEKTFIHPEFDEELLFANIAVLKLKTPLFHGLLYLLF